MALTITGKPKPDSSLCEFKISQSLAPGFRVECKSVDDGKDSPLLKALMEIPGVEQVVVEGRTITVEKSSDQPWIEVGKALGGVVRSQVESQEKTGLKLFSKSLYDRVSEKLDPEEEAIRDLLDTEINPAVAAHGGHIELLKVEDHVAYVELSGGCQGCGMSKVTLQNGVEVAIKRKIPTIQKVVDLTNHDQGTQPFFEKNE
tara:strand:+ start:917 stop:1522 length:606 start_codon:yes stop_codon:yes gene_type:complete